MPKSRIRKKKDRLTPPEGTKTQKTKIDLSSGRRWVAPLMLAMFAIGLAWIVVFYVTEGRFPVEALGNWNILVGFGFIGVGFVVSTQWK
ncbi:MULTISPECIES: cell division protein CrgA [Streptomyces]|uniref:Cell division protein CrgA n=2 Tax=Streptomyces TaxID=1883 RepID=A0A5P0YKM2_9ACTN|nr:MULTISPECIES: cell division protein CrgA [Streptomyces]MBB1246600.1 cell division protein CrgA [Streptomyces durbertensis]MBB1252430.1 cell division protein CrgA [Streptomyces alkaliterrae]MBB1260907.1 cell division protein CrgA [Streptomyces alkaliterrae]MQS00460.1 cell division protein CrgA [Streptomyces alkaliterrae]